RSIEGCCICRAKSSSSRFTDSKRYEKDFQSCFGDNVFLRCLGWSTVAIHRCDHCTP
ncbi:FAM60A isoform 5, partial [Pongo abelii]